MQPLHENIFLLHIYIILFISESSSLTPKVPLWSWECENEKCVPFKSSETQEKLQSLETCNMLCSAAVLWPLPTGPVSTAATAVSVRSDLFQVEIDHAPTNIVKQHLQDAFQLFKKELQLMEGKTRSFEKSHTVIVRLAVNDSGNPDMRLDTDESYQITLEPEHSSALSLVAEIISPSFCGARHGLETLLQLVWLDHYVGSLLMIQEATISDKPKFGYRGLMIDTARNHIPFGELLRTVDAMAASKLNTLHWHASDSQSFSLQFNSVPELARRGAIKPSNIYSSEQVKTLVRRARLRGIRVIIEIDTPAHVNRAWNWGPEKHSNIVQCVDSKPWNLYCPNPPCGQLDPHHPFVFEVLQNIYSDIIQTTGVDDIFHVGADDVSESCWSMISKDLDPMVSWIEFTRSAFERLEYVNGKLPNLVLFWSSRLSGRIKTDLKDYSNYIGLQVRNLTWAKKYTTGLRTIVSHEDVWDLNSGHGAWHEHKSKAPYNSWQRFYEHRPWVKSGSDNILGGEATLWSWTVGEGGLDARVWPRAAALAERLWSDLAEGATRTVHARLDMHRIRLAIRGVQCAPIWSYWCTQNPYTCS